MAAFVAASWWVLFFGLLGVGALTVRRAFQPEFGRRVLEGAAERPALPCADEVGDPDLRCIVRALGMARARIGTLGVDTGDAVTPYLGSLLAAVASLERSAGALIRRTDRLSSSLRLLDRAVVVADHGRLASLAALTSDPASRREYERAVDTRRDDLRVIDELIAHQARVSARLWHAVATLDGLPARILHMRLLDSQASHDLSSELDRELERVSAELVASEQAFAGLAEPPSTACLTS